MLNVVTKGEFARLVNLSPGRISQLITEGKIADCIVLDGGKEKIDADKAIEKLKIRRDPGQALGNGAKTVLTPTAAGGTASTTETDDLDIRLKREKLAEAEARNRKVREEEKFRAGTYVLADDVKAETAKLTNRILQLFEGGLNEVASEIAAQFKLPQRDVLHLLRKRFRDVRTNVSTGMAADADAMPSTIEDQIED